MTNLSDERIEQLIATLYVLPAKQKIVNMDRDEALALIREVKRSRTLTLTGKGKGKEGR